MFLKNLLVLTSLAAVLVPAIAVAQAIEKDGTPRYVETNLIPEFNSITAGQPLHFAITQKHSEG